METFEFILLCIAVAGNLFWGAKALHFYSLMSAPNLLSALKAKKTDVKLGIKAKREAEKDRDEYKALAEKLKKDIVLLQIQGDVSQSILTTIQSAQVKLENPKVHENYIESVDRYYQGVQYIWPWQFSVEPQVVSVGRPDGPINPDEL